MKKTKRYIMDYALICLGSLLYGFSTVFFIFPQSIPLGGTSGVSVILTSFLSSSPGMILTVINMTLLLLALLLLGKSMALKTLVGSTLTSLSVSLFEAVFPFRHPPVASMLLSAMIGAALIALASAILFFVDSSSGGTDIIALIIKKFSRIDIGKALLITDVLIVLIGGLLSGWYVAVCSCVGLLIKTLGIDPIIRVLRFLREHKKKTASQDHTEP